MKEKYRHPQFSTKGLVAYYKLFAGLTFTARVFDYAQNGFIGVPTGTNIAPAYPGFLFNGTDDKITFASGPASVSSVFMWIKANATTAEDLISLNLSDALTISTGTLTKLGFAGTTALYVDGVAGTTVTTDWHLVGITDTVAKDASAGNMALGFVSSSFDGKIGETMLFDRVLSPAEIKSIYELTKWRYPNN